MFLMMGSLMINPEWNGTQAPPTDVTEGCYSIGAQLYKVQRAPYGWARWQTITGEWREEKLKGLQAIVFQHELDHLDGKCCIDTGVPVEAGVA
jgi:peptide deformylase